MRKVDALRALATDTKLLFRSDCPAFPLEQAAREFAALDLPDITRRPIARDNAVAFLPRWNS